MTTNIGSKSSATRDIRQLEAPEFLTGLLLVALWWLAFYQEIFAPWIQGLDSVTRLYHIDSILVTVKGNTWLPLTQAILKAVNLTADNPIIYKLVIATISSVGMYLFFVITTKVFNIWVGIFSFSYFFLHAQWSGAAINPYMEGIFLCTTALSILSWLHGKNFLGAFFFIVATFSRPELLLAAPAILLMHLLYFRERVRTLKYALLFLPIIAFYLYLKFFTHQLSTPADYSLSNSLPILLRLTSSLQQSLMHQIFLIFSLFSLLLLFFDQHFWPAQSRALKYIAAGLAIFYFEYVFVLPIFHSFGSSSTRMSIMLMLPIYLFASLCLEYIVQKLGAGLRKYVLAVLTLLIFVTAYSHSIYPPWSFLSAKHLSKLLHIEGYDYGQELSVCLLDRQQLIGRDLHETKRWPLLLHLRFFGWRIIEIPCEFGDSSWQNRSPPILRIYDGVAIKPDYKEMLVEGCTKSTKIKDRGKIFASACF